MRLYLLLFLFIVIAGTSQAGTGNDRIAGSRADYLKNKIAGGNAHTLEIRNGQLWAWGRNAAGQLGDGTTTNRNNPIQIGTADNWICVTAGGYHSLGIRADGSLWAWGSNGSGQLGDGTTTFRSAPVRIGTGNTWVAVVAGEHHTLAVKADGTLWAWGNNVYGQLGDGSTTDRNAPVQIGTARDWVTIAPGGGHSMAIKANGTLWVWGNNNAGQLGDGSKTSRIVPVQVGTANNWINVAAGGYHSIGLQANGTLWAWGENNEGQLGDSTYTDTTRPVQIDTARNWTGISAGAYHNLALKANGTLWAWGRNDDGELGDSTNTKRNVPVHIDTANRWKGIYTGAMHSLGIKANGAVMAWGDNQYGQLGNGANADKNYATQVHEVDDEWQSIKAGHRHSIALKSDGTLWAWGQNIYGQLGDSTTVSKNSAVQIGAGREWITIVASVVYSLGIAADGTLWAWGNNFRGNLGDGTNIDKNYPVQVGTADDWVAISSRGGHSLAIKADGTLWAWGQNDYGELGNNTKIDKNIPTQIGTAGDWITIEAGGFHSLAIKTDGTLWAWGGNDDGKLGDGTTSDRHTPVKIGTANDWACIAGGDFHSGAVKSDGTLWAWGLNQSGEIGDGTKVMRTSPVKIGLAADWLLIDFGASYSMGIKADGTLWEWGGWPVKNSPMQVGAVNSWVNITTSNFILGIKAYRRAICYTGSNKWGELGDGTNTDRNTIECRCMDSKIEDKPYSSKACVGGNAYFKLNSRYSYRYQWQANFGNGWTDVSNNPAYSRSTTDSLEILSVDTSYSKHWYRCIAYNYCDDSTISDSAQIVFNTSEISLQPTDTSVCANTNAGFSVSATGGPFTYQWQVNDGSGWSNVGNTGMYSGADKDTLLLKAAPTTVNGYKYRCIVGGICPPGDTSDEAVLTITTKYNAPAVITQPASARIMENSDTTFTIASADPDLSYQWQVNDGTNWTDISNTGVYSGATTDTLNLTGVPYVMNGYQYRCLLIRPCAPINVSSAATLTVDTIPAGIATTSTAFKTLTLHPNPNSGTFIIEGELTTVVADEVNVTILNSLGQVVYRGAIQSSSGKINHTINTGKDLAPGSYMLKLDYNGQQDYKRFVIMK